MKAQSKCISQFKKVWYLTHMRAANPTEGMQINAQAKFLGPVHESLVQVTYIVYDQRRPRLACTFIQYRVP